MTVDFSHMKYKNDKTVDFSHMKYNNGNTTLSLNYDFKAGAAGGGDGGGDRLHKNLTPP